MIDEYSYSDEELLSIYKNSIESLKSLMKVQCSNGNWNHNSYMHGLANGLILAYSLFDDKRPEFLAQPDIWLEDLLISYEITKNSEQHE